MILQAGTVYTPVTHGDLKLPDGTAIKDADRNYCYREFDRLKIPGFAHTLGFAEAVGKYAAYLDSLATAAGKKAVSDFLESNKVAS